VGGGGCESLFYIFPVFFCCCVDGGGAMALVDKESSSFDTAHEIFYFSSASRMYSANFYNYFGRLFGMGVVNCLEAGVGLFGGM
jgi:hypothetical protein